MANESVVDVHTASKSERVYIAVALSGVVIFAIIGSVLTLLVFLCRRKIRRPHLYFPVALCIVDIIAVCVWTTLTIHSLLKGSWNLPYEVCVLQNYVMTFCNANNMHMFMLLGIERTLIFLKPSKHDDIFTPCITSSLIGAVWFMDLIIAFMPTLRWGEVRYYPAQYQCIPEYQLSTSHLNFLFVTTYVIPICVLIFLAVLCYRKLRASGRKVVPQTGAIIMEENNECKANIYAYNVKRNNKKFKNVGIKNKKPKLKPTIFTTEGYISDSETDDESTNTEIVKKQIYLLSKTDHDYLKTYVIIICVYVLSWFPYVILSYTWTYDRYVFVPEWLLLFTVVLTHATNCIKPLICYVSNKTVRRAFNKTLCPRRCCRKGSKP